MFTTGFAIFLGLVVIFIKLPRRTMLRWLNYDMLLDVAVTLIVLAVHFGTFSGQPVDTDSVLVKYTWNGDADLSGASGKWLA